jgi:hypothetical protein
MRRSNVVLLIAATAVWAAEVQAMTINTTFDSSVTSLPAAAQWESAWNYATGQIQSLYSDPITINLTLTSGTPSGILGQSGPQLQTIGTLDPVG